MRSIPLLDRIRLMQSLQHAVTHHMPYWTSGNVRVSRILDGWTLPDKHRCNASKSEQVKMRRHGDPRTRLVILDPHSGTSKLDDVDHAEWWMLSTGPIETEDLFDARRGDQRIRLGDYWELVHLTGRNGLTWTWRANVVDWVTFCGRGLHYARQKDLTKARRLVDDLARWPGFAGFNVQRRQLFAEMRHASGGRLTLPALAHLRFLKRREVAQDKQKV